MAGVLTPPQGAGCRPWKRRPEDAVDQATRRYEFLDELDVRRSYRTNLESILGKPEGWANGALYRDSPDAIPPQLRETTWETRWGVARTVELGYTSVFAVA